MQIQLLVQKLGLSNTHKDGEPCCPQCLKGINDRQMKFVGLGFVWHEPCYRQFTNPPLRLVVL